MNLDTALTKARGLQPRQAKTAAHLYNTIEWELTYLEDELAGKGFSGPPSPAEAAKLEHERQVGESALAVIEERFPNVKEQADEITSGPRSLSARATRGLTADHEHDRQHEPSETRELEHAGAPSSPSHARTSSGSGRRPSPPKPAPAGPPARRAAAAPGPRARARRTAARTSRSTVRNITRTVNVVDQATGGWGSDAWTFILGGIGLSFMFLILTHPNGLSNLMKGTSNVLAWVIDPTIDPLRPTTTGAHK